jgi:hypothetical protein
MVRSRWERRATSSKPALGLLAVLITTVSAACGGSAAVNNSIGRLTAPGTELPLIAGPGPSADIPVVRGASPVDSQAFCEDLRRLQVLLPALFQAKGSAVALGRAEELVTRILTDAPKELRPAVQELAETARRLTADFGTNPPNLVDVARVLTDPVYRQALEHLGGYAANHC